MGHSFYHSTTPVGHMVGQGLENPRLLSFILPHLVDNVGWRACEVPKRTVCRGIETPVLDWRRWSSYDRFIIYGSSTTLDRVTRDRIPCGDQ